MKLLSTFKHLLETQPLWVQELLRHPRKLSHWLEEKHPALAQHFISYASDVLEPYWWARGLKVEDLSDHGVRLSLPYNWRNRSWSGGFYRGVIVSLAELALHLFWERHLDPSRSRLIIGKIVLDVDQPLTEDIYVQIEMDPSSCDQALYFATSQGQTTLTLEAIIYNRDQRRLGSVEFHYELHSTGAKSLSGRQ